MKLFIEHNTTIEAKVKILASNSRLRKRKDKLITAMFQKYGPPAKQLNLWTTKTNE